MGKIEWIVGGIIAVVVVVGIVLTTHGRGSDLGGGVTYEESNLVGDVYQGITHKLMMQNGSFVGPINTSQAATFGAQVKTDAGVLRSGVFATSSAGAATYTASSITGIETILHTATAALTATLPASTTLSTFLPTTGDMRQITIVNTGTGTAYITLAGGTGTLLSTASTTKQILPGGAATLNFVRKANTDIAVSMTTAI